MRKLIILPLTIVSLLVSACNVSAGNLCEPYNKLTKSKSTQSQFEPMRTEYLSSKIFTETKKEIVADFFELRRDYSLGFGKCLKRYDSDACLEMAFEGEEDFPEQEEIVAALKKCEAEEEVFKDSIDNYNYNCISRKIDEKVIGWIPFVFFENKDNGYSHPANNTRLYEHYEIFKEKTFDHFYSNSFKEEVNNIFEIAKELLSETISELVVDDVKAKVIIEQIINKSSLYDRHKYLYVKEALSANADPEVLKVNYWPGLFDINSITRIEMLHVLVHELSHFIDPVVLYDFDDPEYPLLLGEKYRFAPMKSSNDYIISNFLDDFEKKYDLEVDYSGEEALDLSYSDYVRRSQLREAVPDYFAAHVVKKYLDKNQENESIDGLMKNFICNGDHTEDERRGESFRIHPEDETRAKILTDILYNK